MYSQKLVTMLKKDIKIAVVGATGNVGRAMINILAEKGFPKANVTALASRRSSGGEISYGDIGVLRVHALDGFNFLGTHIVLSSAGSKISETFVPTATAAGTIVIDNASFFRMDKNVPLIVPEVNPDTIDLVKKQNIVANPNCSMIQLAMALKPLDTIIPIKRVVVSTYQSVSGAGKRGMDELLTQTRAIYMNSPTTIEQFPKTIAFNVIPNIGDIEDSGDTGEEIKIAQEFKKVMGRAIPITATAVRVPVFIGHSMSVNIEFDSKMTPSDARAALKKAPGVKLLADLGNYMTPIEVAGEDAVYVSRVRKDPSCESGLNLWVVADNLRKGAALNAVQILELLIAKKLI